MNGVTSKAVVAVRDPLGESTRRERRTLLGVAIVGIIIVKTGVLPTKLTAIGVEFSPNDQKILLFILGLTVTYLLFGFLIYAAADFIAWRLAFRGATDEPIQWIDPTHSSPGFVSHSFERTAFQRVLIALSRPLSFLRFLFEFVLPVVVAGYAIYLLWRWSLIQPP